MRCNVGLACVRHSKSLLKSVATRRTVRHDLIEDRDVRILVVAHPSSDLSASGRARPDDSPGGIVLLPLWRRPYCRTHFTQAMCRSTQHCHACAMALLRVAEDDRISHLVGSSWQAVQLSSQLLPRPDHTGDGALITPAKPRSQTATYPHRCMQATTPARDSTLPPSAADRTGIR